MESRNKVSLDCKEI